MLVIGQKLFVGGVPHVVVRVTESRATVVPVELREVKIRTLMGRQVTFRSRGLLKSISPNSELSAADLALNASPA